MFKTIFTFELAYRLKRPATYIYFLIYLLVGLLYGGIIGGMIDSQASIALSGGGKNFQNSPVLLHTLVSALGQIGLFAIAAIMGVPIYRDFEHKMHELFFTKPITKASYLMGRFFGSLLITLAVLSSIIFGLMAGIHLLGDPDVGIKGPFVFYHYLEPFLFNLLPNTLFFGTIIFALVSLTRTQVLIYLSAIIVLVLLGVAQGLIGEIDNKTIAGLLEPTASIAYSNLVEKWTVAEKNTRTLPFDWVYVANRIIWISVSLIFLAVTYARFNFSHALGTSAPPKRRAKASALANIARTVTAKNIRLPKVSQSFSLSNQLSLLYQQSKRETLSIVQSPVFIGILSAGVILMLFTAFIGTSGTENSIFPVTGSIMQTLNGSLGLFSLVIIAFYAAELVWKERELKISGMVDAMPLPNWLPFASKFMALFVIQLLFSAIILVSGLALQTIKGFYDYEIGLYFQYLFFFRLLTPLLQIMLAMFIQTVVNNKYMGIFLFVIILLGSPILGLLGIEHNMLLFGGGTGLTYSAMNGFGHFVGPYLWFKAYWLSFGLILLVLANLLWVRGAEANLKVRWKQVFQNLNTSSATALTACTLLFIGIGGFVFYNTNIINEFKNSKENINELVDFEKAFKIYQDLPQPKITDVKLNVDLFPYQRSFDASGTYQLQNQTAVQINEVHVVLPFDFDNDTLAVNRGFRVLQPDERFDYFIIKLDEPLLPKDSLELSFSYRYAIKGFSNGGSDVSMAYNGTFINSQYFPKIGYDDRFEISDNDVREEKGLARKQRLAAVTDTAAYNRNFISRDANWINFEATVSTAGDQKAIVPGYLQKEWQENGRNYYHYKMDAPMLNFYNVVSARYDSLVSTWQAPDGREISLEIYYHPPHTYNTERMMEAIKKSLAYYSENFSPYQHSQVRILEFPYRTFAQSFANTIPYSENFGFIADIDKDDDSKVDWVFFVTAHELAHQWWAHQVISADVQGSQIMSETMSQYGALMVLRKEQGEAKARTQLKQEMNRYLLARSSEKEKELPLLLTENQQYLHYRKGIVVMNALQDLIGEDSLNVAMQRYIEKVKFQQPPYTISPEWYSYIKAATPDNLKEMVADQIERIVLFENEAEEAFYTLQEDSTYLVTLKTKSKKYQADAMGEETEMPLADYRDIGIMGRQQVDGKMQDTTLYLKKYFVEQEENTYTISVDFKPYKAGIDPYNILIDRSTGKNTALVKEGESKEVNPENQEEKAAPDLTEN